MDSHYPLWGMRLQAIKYICFMGPGQDEIMSISGLLDEKKEKKIFC